MSTAEHAAEAEREIDAIIDDEPTLLDDVPEAGGTLYPDLSRQEARYQRHEAERVLTSKRAVLPVEPTLPLPDVPPCIEGAQVKMDF